MRHYKAEAAIGGTINAAQKRAAAAHKYALQLLFSNGPMF
jgi:hypothetical protein